MANRVEVLQNGFCHSSPRDEVGSGETFPKADDLPFVRANCSCVLITGSVNVIVDTMTPWDSDFILKSLNSRGLKPDDIDYVVSTHGHSDHIGNNNLFLKAKHIVGYCVSFQDKYFLHPFDKGVPFQIGEGIQVIPTPGHTSDDVSVVVETKDLGVVVIAGDVFEREEDIERPEIWKSDGGSVDPERQSRSRMKIAQLADYIVPGHGPMFRVTDAMRNTLLLAAD